MVSSISGRRVAASFISLCLIVAQVLPAVPAHAKNIGTVSGNNTIGCAVNWTAQTRYNDPSLNPDLSGNSVDPANGGYVSEVSPTLGGPGLLEVQHFQASWLGNNVIAWRVPVATSHTIHNASLTFTADAANGTTSAAGISGFDYVHTNSTLLANFPNEWTLPANPSNLGTIPANSHSTQSYIWYQTLNEPFSSDKIYTATATLIGTYAMGRGCTSSVPDAPSPINVAPCDFYTYGRTTWQLGASDISTREKFDAYGNLITGSVFDAEINADGWGMVSADGWNNGTVTYRLYAGTHTELNDVNLTWDLTQGFTFTQPTIAPTVVTGTPSGMGALYGNGFVNPVNGLGSVQVAADGTVTLHIDHMPAHSGIAFTLPAQLDGTYQTMSMNSTMLGKRTGCVTVPVIHNSMPTLAKVDQDSSPLSGARVTGLNCTRWENDLL